MVVERCTIERNTPAPPLALCRPTSIDLPGWPKRDEGVRRHVRCALLLHVVDMNCRIANKTGHY